jgi:hypothetical protein
VGSEADFDRYVAEHNIPEEEWPEAFARWIAEHTGGPVPGSRRSSLGTSKSLKILSSANWTAYLRSWRYAIRRAGCLQMGTE